ncbi:nucleolar protein 8 isoform X6 [Aquarana catesbeiana]|uniref:nucleolar protein 8 isoform X6 n=1 Tax=Aquarana catesbeiana TaxID=8400 RepID=UPI003CC95AB4
METLRRVYVGGISPLVTKAELEDRFGKFGRIDDVDIICRKDAQGNPIKTFAYLNINISDVDLKKLFLFLGISVLNKTKWKGGILQIEKAKESFLHRLSKERQEAKEEGANAPCLQNDIVLSLEKAGVTDFLMKFAVPGTEVPNHKNWVVSKFGRVLPVLHLNGKNQSKIMKYDPSKYCHNIKKIDDTFKLVPVSQLTWQLGGEDDEIGRKRRGVFPNLMSPQKKKAVIPPISGGYNDAQMDQRIPLASIQTAERQSNTKEKRRHLQNSSINSMTDEYDTEEELQSVLKREAATRTVKYAEDCYIEDDSSELSYAAYWTKQNAIPKMNSTFHGLDDSEYESANTDEIITVAKTLQKRCDHFKTKAETVKVDEFNQIKIQKCKEGSTFSHGTNDKCKSMNIEMNNSESDSETGASENDSSSFYSDEEYKAMMQNCLKLGLTIGDLETLVKEANEFKNNADDKTENDGECDNDDINSKDGYGVAENPLASGSKIPTLEKKQNARLVSAGIKKKLNTENLQRVLESGSQGNCDESDSSDSDFEKHYEPININDHRENVKTKALKRKSPLALQCLVNHELKKRAQGKKGETNKDWYPGFENIKAKRGLEPDDIVASILEGDGISDQQSFPKKKINTPVKPPAFKGLSSVSASAAKANSVFGSSTISSVENAAVTEISNVLKQSSYGSKQTKQAERPEPSRDSKLVFLEAKSKIRSSSSDSEKCNSGLCCNSSSFAKHSISQIDAAKEKTTLEVKQKQDNQKRLVAMMARRKELELQKQIIQGALLELDSKCSKKSQHFVFNSDSTSDEEASTSEKNMFAHNNANQSTSKLFNSSEEDSDNDEKEDNERFEIKAQYEGRSGMKLMQLQSRFGTDDRFKMDSRFLESSSEDEPSEAHNSMVDEEYDLSAEKKKNLGILQSILNINVEPQPARKQTTKGKKFKEDASGSGHWEEACLSEELKSDWIMRKFHGFRIVLGAISSGVSENIRDKASAFPFLDPGRDLNSLHFDPEKKDHATFETKAEERESKSERMKKQLEAERLPDVSKETFHEISMDFREVFGASKTQKTKGAKTTWDQVVEPEKKEAQKSRSSELFSLQNKNIEEPVEFTFSFFGNTTEESTSNSEPYKTKTIKPAKVAWQEDPRFQDSSSEEDDEETTVAIENKTSTQPDISTIRFFFVKDDERLKTGPTMFFRSSNTEQEAEVWEQKKDILLEIMLNCLLNVSVPAAQDQVPVVPLEAASQQNPGGMQEETQGC